nr:MAG TPA: hypothetical protein [Bacteriophage sp.]
MQIITKIISKLKKKPKSLFTSIYYLFTSILI